MNNKISAEELGELRCSDLDLPMLTSETFDGMVLFYLEYISNEQFTLLAAGCTDTATVVLLTELCNEIIAETCNLVLETVTPQISSWNCSLSLIHSKSDYSNTSVTRDKTESPKLRNRNYQTVTEEDIQAALGNSLHCSLVKAFDVEVEDFHNSQQLLQLVAEVVAKKVNGSLAGSTSTQNPGSPVELETMGEITYHVAKIMERSLLKQQHWSAEEENQFSVSSQESSTDTDFAIEEFYREIDEGFESAVECPALSPTKELSQGEETFLALLLGKLLDHIAQSTETSVLDLDFSQTLRNLKKTVGGLSCSLPHTVGHLHKTVFKELCVEFGSEKLLQAALVSDGMAFEEAVARVLKGQLQKDAPPHHGSEEEERTSNGEENKEAPACEVATSVDQAEGVAIKEAVAKEPIKLQKDQPSHHGSAGKKKKTSRGGKNKKAPACEVATSVDAADGVAIEQVVASKERRHLQKDPPPHQGSAEKKTKTSRRKTNKEAPACEVATSVNQAEGVAIKEAVARELIKQLQKDSPSHHGSAEKKRTSKGEKNKKAPACEVATSVDTADAVAIEQVVAMVVEPAAQTNSFLDKVRRFFKRRPTTSPTLTNNESHSDGANPEDGSRARQQRNQRRAGICSMFSLKGRFC